MPLFRMPSGAVAWLTGRLVGCIHRPWSHEATTAPATLATVISATIDSLATTGIAVEAAVGVGSKSWTWEVLLGVGGVRSLA